MTTPRAFSILLLIGFGACAGSTSAASAGASAPAKNAAPFATKRTLPSRRPITVTMRDSMSSQLNTLGNQIGAQRDIVVAPGTRCSFTRPEALTLIGDVGGSVHAPHHQHPV